MGFLERTRWMGKLFSTEGWVAGSGGEYDAVEPATGNKLARVGAATPTDVHKAAEAAAQAQREWAALTNDRRAEVLRRAGQLFVEHEDEIHDWLIRESGAIRPFAQFQTRAVAAEECYEAAALAAHPYGELLRSNQQRLSMAHRLPAGVVGVAGGTYDGLFYRPTVLSEVPLTAPAYAEEIFGPVAPVVSFSGVDEAVRLANSTEYGLSLGILTRDVMKGLEIAERIPSGLVHINDQTVNDEALIPFGGVGESGTGSRHGGTQANLDAFTDVQWVTLRGDLPQYPF